MVNKRQEETKIKGWKKPTSLATRASFVGLEVIGLMVGVEDVKARVLRNRREKEMP